MLAEEILLARVFRERFGDLALLGAASNARHGNDEDEDDRGMFTLEQSEDDGDVAEAASTNDAESALASFASSYREFCDHDDGALGERASALSCATRCDALFADSIGTALTRSFSRLSQAIASSAAVPAGCGTTALAAYVVGELVFVANAGDTRAVLRRESARLPVRLSVDHKASEPREAARVTASGSVISCVAGSVPRVAGYLAVTRAMHGAPGLADAVTWRPSVSCDVFRSTGDVLLLASDGVWDRLSDRTAASLAAREFEASASLSDAAGRAARSVVQFAYDQKSGDNISVLCVCPRPREDSRSSESSPTVTPKAAE